MRGKLFAVGGLLAMAAAQGVESLDGTPSPINDRFALSFGYYRAALATQARVDNTSTALVVPGTPFSAERDFGLPDSSNQLRVEILFRMGERNRLRVDMFDLQRRGSATLAQDYTYGGSDFLIGDVIASKLDWRQMGFTWTYSVLRNDRFELGAGLGLYAVQAEAQATRVNPAAREEFDGAGPFPTLALDGTWRITRRFAFNARANYLKLSVDGITGKLGDYQADVQYRAAPNLAFGLGYERQDVAIDIPHQSPAGEMSMRLSGPKLFVRASF